MERSIKAERILKRLGVMNALDRGEVLVLVGPTYELRKDPGIRVRMAFLRGSDGELCIGYANDEDGWQPIEFEPFSLRALGYYQRRLKRIGEVTARDLG
jgi:hypothetical protein